MARTPRHTGPPPVRCSPQLLAGRWFSARVRIRDPHVLDRLILAKPFGATLASETGLFHAAERGRGIGNNACAQAQHSALNPLTNTDGTVDVPGKDVGSQAVFGVVGELYRLVFRGEGSDRGDRSEDFLLKNLCSRAHAAKNRRVVEVTGALNDVPPVRAVAP